MTACRFGAPRPPRLAWGIAREARSRSAATHMLPAITYSHCQGHAGSAAAPERRTDDRTDAEEAFDRVHDRRVFGRGCEMSPMSASAPVLKMPMATPESAISTQKNRNELARDEEVGRGGEERQADDDGRFPSEAVRQMTKEEAGQRRCPPSWRTETSRRRSGSAGTVLMISRNDDADRVGRHREHREHDVGQRLDQGHVLGLRDVAGALIVRPPSTTGAPCERPPCSTGIPSE